MLFHGAWYSPKGIYGHHLNSPWSIVDINPTPLFAMVAYYQAPSHNISPEGTQKASWHPSSPIDSPKHGRHHVDITAYPTPPPTDPPFAMEQHSEPQRSKATRSSRSARISDHSISSKLDAVTQSSIPNGLFPEPTHFYIPPTSSLLPQDPTAPPPLPVAFTNHTAPHLPYISTHSGATDNYATDDPNVYTVRSPDHEPPSFRLIHNPFCPQGQHHPVKAEYNRYNRTINPIQNAQPTPDHPAAMLFAISPSHNSMNARGGDQGALHYAEPAHEPSYVAGNLSRTYAMRRQHRSSSQLAGEAPLSLSLPSAGIQQGDFRSKPRADRPSPRRSHTVPVPGPRKEEENTRPRRSYSESSFPPHRSSTGSSGPRHHSTAQPSTHTAVASPRQDDTTSRKSRKTHTRMVSITDLRTDPRASQPSATSSSRSVRHKRSTVGKSTTVIVRF
ncbi:hypothetical protein HGRIS_011867 [Hohenbuehelia grisea]|uniref:Uncharacterized protein n=1 Tax=Hohenbuehelia grisea TaxID=104357 RepID=A0ABR3JXA0_9AGAR